MRAPVVMLADRAEVTPNGLVNVSGGGWDNFSVAGFPAHVSGDLVLVIEFDVSELGGVYDVSVEVVDEDGRSAGSSFAMPVLAQRARGDVDSPLRLARVLPFSAVVMEPRRLTVRSRIGDVPLGDCALSIIAVE